MSLRPRGHNFELPLLKYELARNRLLVDHYFCIFSLTVRRDVILINIVCLCVVYIVYITFANILRIYQ